MSSWDLWISLRTRWRTLLLSVFVQGVPGNETTCSLVYFAGTQKIRAIPLNKLHNILVKTTLCNGKSEIQIGYGKGEVKMHYTVSLEGVPLAVSSYVTFLVASTGKKCTHFILFLSRCLRSTFPISFPTEKFRHYGVSRITKIKTSLNPDEYKIKKNTRHKCTNYIFEKILLSKASFLANRPTNICIWGVESTETFLKYRRIHAPFLQRRLH